MPSQLERLDSLLAGLEAEVQAAFRDFVRNVNDEHVAAVIANLIENGDINGALDIVDSYVARMANVLPAIQQKVGAVTAAELAASVGRSVMAIGFDPSFPRAAEMAMANRLEFIEGFSKEQRAATRMALAEAFMRGSGTAETARAFRNSIGLNSAQMGWAISYERRLRSLDIKALAMDLRDRRYDRTVRRAIETGRALTEKQIAGMLDRYRLRALMYRSETIARTEAVRATSFARHEAALQMLGQTGMDPRRVIRVWNAVADHRTRDHHHSMNGQRVRFDERFTDGLGNELMYPGDPAAPAETVINCRCAVTYDILPPSQEL